MFFLSQSVINVYTYTVIINRSIIIKSNLYRIRNNFNGLYNIFSSFYTFFRRWRWSYLFSSSGSFSFIAIKGNVSLLLASVILITGQVYLKASSLIKLPFKTVSVLVVNKVKVAVMGQSTPKAVLTFYNN